MLTWERKAVAPHGPIPTWIPSPHRWRHTVASRDMRLHCRTGCGWCLQPPGRYSWDGCTTGLVETPTRKTCHRACGNTYTENMSQGLWKHLHGKHVRGLVETPTRKTCQRACGNTYTENMSQGLWKHLHGKHVRGLVETPTRKTCLRACGNTYTENMSEGLWKHLHGKHVRGLVETPTRKTCHSACGNTYMENMSTGLVETPTRKSRLRLPDNITKCVFANEIVWTHTGVILTNKVSSFVASGLR